MACEPPPADGYCPPVHPAARDGKFYAYYRLDRKDKPSEAEAEPRKEGELRTEYRDSHSPFGYVWQVASATGWSVDYILNGINYQTLIMMLADAPGYVTARQHSPGNPEPDDASAEEEAGNIVGFFQSKLS